MKKSKKEMRKLFGFAFLRITDKDQIVVKDDLHDLCVYKVCIICSGLPQSGKNNWKMKFFPGQGKVRELCGWPGKFRKDLES